jgi:hypothetical protein
MTTRHRITEAELRELYYAQGFTMVQVASNFVVAPTTILRRFRDLGIRARPRGPVPDSRSATAPIEWTADLAYAVGLIATDGNLSRKPGRLSITSNDVDLLDMLRRRLNLTVPIRPHRGGYGHRCHHIAWSDRRFYDWLTAAGLTPAKSLTLGPLAIPDEHFADFFRGCIDGDGSIITYVDRYNTFKSPAYVYTRLFVSIVSASPRFVEWLQARVRCLRGLSGSLTIKRSTGRRDMWRLRYAKRESLALLRWIYYAPELLCLGRKRDIAAPFLLPRDPPCRRGPGRPMVV